MNHWTVKQKLSALILGVVISFSALTGFLLVRQVVASTEMQSLYDQDYRVASMIGDIDGLLTRVDINILRMVAIGDPASIATWKAQNSERFTKVDALLTDLRAAADPSALATVKTLSDSYALLRTGMENQVKAIEAGDAKGAGDINRTQVKDNADKTFGALSALKGAKDLQAKGKVEARQAAVATTRAFSLTAAFLVAAGSLALGLLLVRRLTRQLGGEPLAAAEAVGAMAQGDLVARIDVAPGDETSLMARLKQMQTSLSSVVSDVRMNSESVATASAQIAQGNQDLSSRTEQQASSLQQTAASMEELGSTVRQNADNAKQANQLAQSASTVAIQGGEVVSQVVGTMKGINDSSRQIADIISVIDGIAFQTNILALNAAVEAARAGEQGRGFAVVASEVRSLAQRSAEAAKQIKGLISASVERVEQGTALVDQAGVTMTEIVSSIRRVTDIMGEISAASTEQNAGVAQVGQAVTLMDQATQQNAALVEESAAAAESLRQQAQQLVQAVSVFKLSHGGEVSAAASQRHAVRKPAPAKASAKAVIAKAKAPAAATSGAGSDDWASF